MSIVSIEVCPLTGATVDGGWPQGHRAAGEPAHAAHRAHRRGLDGYGSCYHLGQAGGRGGRAALAAAPGRVGRRAGTGLGEAPPGHVLARARGGGRACDQRDRHRPVGPDGQSVRPAGLAAAGRRLSTEDQALRLDPVRRAGAARRTLEQCGRRGFQAIKLGWRPFGRRDRKFDELLVRTARNTVGDSVEMMVDAGGSEQFWPHGTNWARNTAAMLADFGVVWFEEPLPPDDLEGYIELTQRLAGADRRRRGPDAPAGVSALDRAPGRRHPSARLHQERRPERIAAHRLAGVRPQRPGRPPRLEHRRRPGGRPAVLRRHPGGPLRRIPDTVSPTSTNSSPSRSTLDDQGLLTIPTRPGLGVEIDPDQLKRFCPEPIAFR